MKTTWMRHLVTAVFAVAVLLASAGELRRGYAALTGTPGVCVVPSPQFQPENVSSSVSAVLARMGSHGLQAVLDRLGLKSGQH